jgi:hypothetical protein
VKDLSKNACSKGIILLTLQKKEQTTLFSFGTLDILGQQPCLKPKGSIRIDQRFFHSAKFIENKLVDTEIDIVYGNFFDKES